MRRPNRPRSSLLCWLLVVAAGAGLAPVAAAPAAALQPLAVRAAALQPSAAIAVQPGDEPRIAAPPPGGGGSPAAPATAAAMAAASPAWRNLPLWGGDVRSLAMSPSDPNVVLAGTTTGQLYLSQDGGATWNDAGAPLPFPGWVVSGLRWDPNHPGRLWVALFGVWGGGQVAFSDNLGKSWVARSTGLPQEAVYSLALVPGREGRLFAGTLSGVYGTEDGGGHWRQLTGDLPDLQKVTSLMVDPTRPDSVLAGTWRQAYRSDDGGRTWTGSFAGMVLDTEVFSFTPVPEHPGEIWVSSCGWVYQTTDHGDHWARSKDGLDERRTLSFAVLPDGRLLAGTVAGVYGSVDSGKSWKRLSDPALAVTAIAYDPAHPERILIGTEGAGVWRSVDGGADFFPSSHGMTALRVGGLAASGNDLLVAINHAGALSGVYTSRDGGRSFAADFASLPTVLDLAVAAGHPYAATERGLFERRGADWHRLPELGGERVEQLVVGAAVAGGAAGAAGDNGALIARTSSSLYELTKGAFLLRPFKHGPPRSAALYGGALWVSDAQGVYELTRDANHTVKAPFGGGRLQRLDAELLLAGAGGAWVRPGPEADWIELASEPSRVLATGDPRFAALLVSGDVVRLFDRDSHKFRLVPVPIPARDIAGALVIQGKLLLATSGYGVLERDLGE